MWMRCIRRRMTGVEWRSRRSSGSPFWHSFGGIGGVTTEIEFWSRVVDLWMGSWIHFRHQAVSMMEFEIGLPRFLSWRCRGECRLLSFSSRDE